MLPDLAIALGIGLFGRIWGNDALAFFIKNPLPFGGNKFNPKKLLTAILSGCLFLPDLLTAGCVALGIYLGQLLRDSLFGLLRGWNWKAALYMTFRAFSFLPLMLGCYYLSNGFTWNLLDAILCITPMLSRPIVQYLVGLTPIPEGLPEDTNEFVKLVWGSPAIYEWTWMTVIGFCVVGVL